MSDEFAKGFAVTVTRSSREAIAKPNELIGRGIILGEIIGSIYRKMPTIVVTGPKGIGKTSVLRVIETYLADDKELELVYVGLSKNESIRHSIPATFDDFRQVMPYPVYLSINRISERLLVQELMKSLLRKAQIDSRLSSIVNDIVTALKSIKKIKVDLEGVELERELNRITQDDPFEILKTVCLKIKGKFPAGMLLILDDADRLTDSNKSIKTFREELFRFQENQRDLLHLLICTYLDGSLLQPLKYSDEYQIEPLQDLKQSN